MQDLLDYHIEHEPPKVRQDVRRLLNEINKELVDLGTERNSPNQIRVYLTRINNDFHNLVKAGVDIRLSTMFFGIRCHIVLRSVSTGFVDYANVGVGSFGWPRLLE